MRTKPPSTSSSLAWRSDARHFRNSVTIIRITGIPLLTAIFPASTRDIYHYLAVKTESSAECRAINPKILKMRMNLVFAKSSMLLTYALGVLLCAFVVWVLMSSTSQHSTQSAANHASGTAAGKAENPVTAPVSSLASSPARLTEQADGGITSPLSRIREVAAQLGDSRGNLAAAALLGAKSRRTMIRALYAELLRMNNADAVEGILAYLATGEDAVTGGVFEVGPGGNLSDSPTLRVGLLDVLDLLDREQAAACARDILGTSKNPDEWAVALRNHARAAEDPADSFLNQRVGELLSNADWSRNPTAGYLNAFDVAAYTGSSQMVETLVGIAAKQKEIGVVRGAAYLALDRMLARDNVAVLDVLVRQPQAMADAPEMRAELFARVKLADPLHVTLLENYLAQTMSSPEEIKAFLRKFPCADVHGPQGLLTSPVFPNMAALAQTDLTALETVRRWQNDPRFAGLYDELALAKSRLEQWVASAERGQRESENRTTDESH